VVDAVGDALEENPNRGRVAAAVAHEFERGMEIDVATRGEDGGDARSEADPLERLRAPQENALILAEPTAFGLGKLGSHEVSMARARRQPTPTSWRFRLPFGLARGSREDRRIASSGNPRLA
jgi:hypothetical protein